MNPSKLPESRARSALLAISSLCGWLVTAAGTAAPQSAADRSFAFEPTAAGDSAVLPQAMSKLAAAVIDVYRDDDRGRYLDHLFRLQLVAGRYAAALETMAALRAVRSAGHSPEARAAAAANVQYEILARARALGLLERAADQPQVPGRQSVGGRARYREGTRGAAQLRHR
jgi:hypothetical protein